MIATPESVALIMDCYPDGLIVSSGARWRDPAVLDDAVANLVEAAAEEVELPAFGMKAYVWRQPDDARRAEACARLPAGLGDDVVAGLERSRCAISCLPGAACRAGLPAPAGPGADAARTRGNRHPAGSRSRGGRSCFRPERSCAASFRSRRCCSSTCSRGMYKDDPRFAWIPVDPTALFFALSVLVGSFIIVLNPIAKRALPVIFAMLALVVWWAVTLTWSPSKVYGPSKVFYLATLAFWGLIAGALIVGPNPERVRRLFTLLLLLRDLGRHRYLASSIGDDPNALFRTSARAQ